MTALVPSVTAATRRVPWRVVVLVLAVIPLMIVGVWLNFVLGRTWSSEIQSGSGLPGWAGRILPPPRIQALCEVLQERGSTVVLLALLVALGRWLKQGGRADQSGKGT